MFSKEQVGVRPNWEARLVKTGVTPNHWSEGSMTVVKEPPSDLAQAVGSYASEVRNSLNGLFRVGEPEDCISFPNMSSEKVFNGASSSWAHQDFSLPIRFDIAVMKAGGYALLAVKGDYLEGMTSAAAAAKSWYAHHFEGTADVLEVNYLKEHLVQVLQPFGKHASPPSIKDVTVLSSKEHWCAAYIASCLGEGAGLNLSELGCAGLDDLQQVDLKGEPLSSAIIKVTPWSEILTNAEEGSPWIDLYANGARSFVMQPAWVLALDEILDFNEGVSDDQIDMVINVWVSLASDTPIPLVVSSEYKPGYRFEEATIRPFVMALQAPELN